RLETEGLAEPALNMVLSPEGTALRQALIADLLADPQVAAGRLEGLAPLLTSDQSLSGRGIMEKLIAFLLSPEGEETRAQLAAGLRASGNGHWDLGHLMDIAGIAGRIHPDFRVSTLIRVVGGYLWSDAGKPVRNELMRSGTQRALDGIAGALSYLARPTRPPAQPAPLTKQE
ncbi:MAG: hypothetical protein ACP5JJ_11900, partial [Anaerolineae bacterium]